MFSSFELAHMMAATECVRSSDFLTGLILRNRRGGMGCSRHGGSRPVHLRTSCESAS